jgi:hypothetical protein
MKAVLSSSRSWESIDDSQGDLDGDGVLNIDQYNAGIDLRANIVIVYDRDGDGMTDVWELAHGLNPDNPNDAGDGPDGDWISNFEAWRTLVDEGHENKAR